MRGSPSIGLVLGKVRSSHPVHFNFRLRVRHDLLGHGCQGHQVKDAYCYELATDSHDFLRLASFAGPNCRIVQLQSSAYCARYLRASRIGAPDTLSTSLKSLFISSIRKNPLETANAQKARLTIAGKPSGANSPKLTKMMVAHRTSTSINGTAVELLILAALVQLICLRSITIPRANVLCDCWSSFFGDNS